jgi:hypothetical protein
MMTSKQWAVSLGTGFLGLFLVSGILSTLDGFGPDDSQRDSHGTKAWGFLGYYELMERAGFSPQRSRIPAHRILENSPATPREQIALLVLSPTREMMDASGGFIEQLLGEVQERGGYLIVTDPPTDLAGRGGAIQHIPTRFSRLFGRDMYYLELSTLTPQINGVLPPLPSLITVVARNENEISERFFSVLRHSRLEPVRISLKGDGVWKSWLEKHPTIHVPQTELRTITVHGGKIPEGVEPLMLDIDGHRDKALAVMMDWGKGKVLWVGDPRLFSNGLLQFPGQGAALLDFVPPQTRQMIVDGFLNGNARFGNPFVLLFQFPAGLILGLIGLATSLVVWRWGMFPGPADPTPLPAKPDLGAHLSAMAHWLDRPALHRPIMEEFLQLATAELSRQLSPGRCSILSRKELIQQLRRRSPQQADQLEVSLKAIHGLIHSSSPLSPHQFIHHQRVLLSCLLKQPISTSGSTSSPRFSVSMKRLT